MGQIMARKVHNQEAGYVAERMNPFVPGKKVVIYKAEEQSIDVAPDKYAVVCDEHGTIVGASSVPKAREFMKYPEFCEACMELSAHTKPQGKEAGR